MLHSVTRQIGTTTITIETGKMAKLADGAVTVRCGETVVLASVVSSTTLREGQDFFPLTVDYREKAAAAGKFPGGYFKREGRPTEKETLTSRMTDRPLRPLFPKGYFYDTQVISLLLSADGENDPDILSINGASAALAISDIPFAGPIGAVRIGYICGQFIVNPTHTQRAQSELNLVYVGDGKNVIMIEGDAEELPESELIAALPIACQHVATLVDAQKELQNLAGKTKRIMPLLTVCEALLEIAYQTAGEHIETALCATKPGRVMAIESLKETIKSAVLSKFPQATTFEIAQAFDVLQKKALRISILEHKQRCDGRRLHQLRPLFSEVGLIPRAHGSALFQRGETQALALATLATIDKSQMIDAYGGGECSKRFILHYNFPPFSVGETGRFGGSNRREIGHGALAERSIAPVLPAEAEFPYAIRISSDVMESNGSTSMASVCGGTLALMDAGVPIKRPVAGISVGLVTEFAEDGSIDRYATFTDIIGSEDHCGDMDFKLCGTSVGVTGFQLDLKLPGISHEILEEAIAKATEARAHVLQHMLTTISSPRMELNQYAPRIETICIPSDKIGLLIGPGGKTIRGIISETGAEINVEDSGSVHIYSNSKESLQRAKDIIQSMVREVTVGELYQGTVVSIKDFGAFVEVLPGKDGLVHISELSDSRVSKVEDILSIGDSVWVQCIGIDEKGRVKLSRRAAMKKKHHHGTDS